MLDRFNNVIADGLMFVATNEFFRKILLKGNEPSKDLETQEVKDYYNYGNFGQDDIIDVARVTTKEEELFDYVYLPDYHRIIDETKDDFFHLSI